MPSLELNPETKIAFISGGRGGVYILDSLLDEATLHNPDNGCQVTSIPHPYDNGGHTSELRYRFNFSGMGDASQLMAIHIRDPRGRKYFTSRIDGRRTGNELLVIGMKDFGGSLSKGVKDLSDQYKYFVGGVVPISDDNVHLLITLQDDTQKEGEAYIDERTIDEPPIKSLGFIPQDPQPNPDALEKIANADLIILPPATLWGSMLPNLMTPGVRDAILTTRAPIVWYPNAVTTSETHNYKLSDFAERLVCAMGRKIDFAFINNPGHNLPPNYVKAESIFVENDLCLDNPFINKIYQDSLTEIEYNDDKFTVRHNGARSIALLKRALQEAALKIPLLTNY